MKEFKNEKDLSAVEQAPEKGARVSGKNADKKRSSGDQQTPREGPQSAFCLNKSKENNCKHEKTAVSKPSFSFPKENHLRLRRDFNIVYELGKWYQGKYFSVIIYIPEESFGLKAGFSVRKKIYKRAVDRNKIKRRMREIVRLHKNELLKSLWLIIHARSNTLKASYKELNKDFEEICRKAGVLQKQCA